MSYADEYIKRSLRLNRVSEGEFSEDAKKLAALKEKIRLQLNKLESGNFTAAVRNEVVLTISSLIDDTFKSLAGKTQHIAKEAVRREVQWHVDIVNKFTDQNVNTSALTLAFDQTINQEFQGRTFQQWYEATGITASRKAFNTIQAGIIAGDSITQITKAMESIVNQNGHNVRTLVRSNILSAANRSREIVVEENAELFDEKIWESTLDIRTTPHICGIRDQARYTLNNEPIGHDMPWEAGPGAIHFNCRSTFIPKLIGIDIDAPRPSVGAGKDYDRGDNLTGAGRVRKPTKNNRESGIFQIQRKPAGTKYEQWLRTQPKDFVADALGSADKADAFKNGTSLADVTSNPFGTNLTIDEL